MEKFAVLAAAVSAALAGGAVAADRGQAWSNVVFSPGNLVVSRSVYDNNPSNVVVGTILPPNCAATTGGCSAAAGAPYNGTYPFVWNNDLYDPNFGISSKIVLDQMTPDGVYVDSLEVPHQLVRDAMSASDGLVTSFSSKSELGLHLSSDGRYLTFMGYAAPRNAIDVSNSNTPDAVDPTNPVGVAYYRAVAQVDARGAFQFTAMNAYSGNNGRAVILDDSRRLDVYYTAGNAGNGASPQPVGVILGAGAQILAPASAPQAAQAPSTPTPVASFSVTELGAKADKVGKDDNFRAMTLFRGVLYYTKGSGSNGVNTVYFVDTTGKACPNGVGVPVKGSSSPTRGLNYDAATLQTTGLASNMCILAGFPAVPNKTATVAAYPFGLWFADANTLYLADEGDGYTGGTDLYLHAAAQTTAGLQKWTFNKATKVWSLAYVLTAGLGLGIPYSVRGYPDGTNDATGLTWAPATDGLRNITGRVSRDGKVRIWAITSSISGNGDTGADPNRLVMIEDALANSDPMIAASESFKNMRTAAFGEVLRGVAFTPDTRFDPR